MKQKAIKYQPWKFWVDSAGEISIASLVICGISGILLAIPFDISQPYSSISAMLIANPFASFFRNLHYWSAQLFLVFSLIHIVDYLRQKAESNQRRGPWFRLTLSLAFAFFAMLSGFILKGDAESMQAHRIFSSLLYGIPLVGSLLKDVVLGSEKDLQLLYVHHIATATIFLFVVVFEHIRRAWTSWRTTLLILMALSILSILVTAPLHDAVNPLLKGPWYFLGLQEALHWMAQPSWSWLFVILVFLLFYFLYRMPPSLARYSKVFLLTFGSAYLVLTLIGFLFRGEAWKWQPPWKPGQMQQINPYRMGPVVFFPDKENWVEVTKQGMERKESCLICHGDMVGFSASHDPESIGCFSCHLGRPFSANKEIAHRDMLLVPGNLSHSRQSCGAANCHPDLVQRVDRSIMTTLSGMIQVNRFAFGETDTLDAFVNVHQLGQTAADNHFRDLCASCHLGNPKVEAGPPDPGLTGGGCNACHLNYDDKSRKDFYAWKAAGSSDSAFPRVHPALNLDIGDEKCFACHSRSGRISTNYEGWHETLLQAHEVAGVDSLRVIHDLRVFRYVQEDVHHKAGMRCVDCHISWELMGDGNLYAHKEEQTRVVCEDCHSASGGHFIPAEQADIDIRRIASVKDMNLEGFQMLSTAKGGYGLYHTGVDESGVYLLRKSDNKRLAINPPAKVCSQGTVHQRLDCATCHTAWAPTCIGCHNEYDSSVKGYDLYENKYVEGSWVEYVGQYLAEIPSLGVKGYGENEKIITAIPGMILSIDRDSYTNAGEEDVYQRLFAPVSAHTITKDAHSCKDCHNNPLALGFGQGELHYVPEQGGGYWIFHSRFAKRSEDGLPEDAWTGFLDGNAGGATRSDLRALSLEEQRRILLVGTCLECHDQNGPLMGTSVFDFEAIYARRTKACILPHWAEKSRGK